MKRAIEVPALLLALVCVLTGCEPCLDENPLYAISTWQTVPQWTKDGTKIVFAYPPRGIFVVEADGSRMWTMPRNAPTWKPSRTCDKFIGNFSPAISPDGSRVAYAMVDGESSNIVISDIDGSNLRKLTKNSAIDAYPAWSPDGNRIAFVSYRDGAYFRPRLYVMNSDGSNQRSLAPAVSSTIHAPVWSPDGSRIAFVVFQRDEVPREDSSKGTRTVVRHILYTVKPDGLEPRILGDTESIAAWAPDGSRIAFIKREGDSSAVFTMTPDGTDAQLFHDLGFVPNRLFGNLSWSPDGSEFISNFGDSARASGAWSPNGSRIAIIASSSQFEATSNVLVTVARDESDVRVLVKAGPKKFVAANANGVNTSEDIKACSDGSLISRSGWGKGLVQDCETLLQIRHALAGEAALNWSPQVEMAKWDGVVIKGFSPRVVELTLRGGDVVKLNCVIPPELANLSALSKLDLSSNDLRGTIPPALGSLANLKELNLFSNQLHGPIPPGLGNLSNLERLVLRRNYLTGPVSPEMGNLSTLRWLVIEENDISGDIPLELGSLTNLERLGIDYTNLTGCAPTELRSILDKEGTTGIYGYEWCR